MAKSSALSRLDNLQRHFNPPQKSGCDSGVAGLLKISIEVSDALSRGRAVVALESTVIAHGMPYPQNLETAKEVMTVVRENGAIPATIAILDGIPCVESGLEEKDWTC